jgi:DNA-binding SARP family transcriptional activator
MDALIEAVWEENPPPAIVSSVHVAVSGLRRVLSLLSDDARPTLETAAPGYRLNLADGAYDLARFYALRDVGVQHFRAGRYDRAATDLRASLGLWRGAALEDLSRFRFATDFAVAVEEERLVALQLRIDSDLICGHHQEVLAELTDLTARHPLREHFWAQLATTLYRLNRQADALTCLRRLRDVLDRELAIDPSASISELELRILRQELAAEPMTIDRAQELAATVGEPLVSATAELVSSWGAVFPVFARSTRIGRAPDCDIVLTQGRVSRQHAVVTPTQDGLMITDLKSRNGTFVNGQRLADQRLLGDGDVIGIGSVSLTLRAPFADDLAAH